MGDLSTNFDKKEFICKCGCNQYISINPLLILSLELLRKRVGLPLIINSGGRCKKHPLERNKKSTGQHTLGNAADIRIPDGITKKAFLIIILTISHFKGVGLSVDSNYIHLDVRTTPARWGYKNGKQITYNQALNELGWVI